MLFARVCSVRVLALSLCFLELSSQLSYAQFGPAPTCAGTQIGGLVFRDFNASGTRDAQEPGQIGVRATAYDAGNNALGTAVTSLDGTYRIDLSATPSNLRVEFSDIPNFLSSGPAGAQSLTSVTFSSPGNCGINLGLSSGAQFCESDPEIALARFINGDPLQSGGESDGAGTEKAILEFPLSSAGVISNPIGLSLSAQTGPTWGLAYQRSSKTLFAAAFQKRHSGFGPGGTGAIYAINRADPLNPIVSLFVDVQTLGIPTGADPHTGLSGNPLDPSHDEASFDKVGKMSLGDMDISADEQTLWFTNLSNRTLYSLHIGLPAQTPGLNDVEAYAIPNLANCSNNEFVAFAVKVHDGSVYVGGNCTAETSQETADLKAFVLKLDGNVFTKVFEIDLSSYTKGYAIHPVFSPLPTPGYQWKFWVDSITDVFQTFPAFSFLVYPQPMFSNIEFDNDGDLVLNIMDRSGHQFGPFNYNLSPFDDSTVNAPSSGDLLRACAVGSGVWTLENNAACPGETPTAGQNNVQGPGGGEFYVDDRFSVVVPNYGPVDVHQETTVGASVIRPGAGETVSTAYDIFQVEDGGLTHFDNVLGTANSKAAVYPSTRTFFGKAAGLGDLELLCSPAPVEIGNRVWRDLNNNGRQDAGEPGIAGVTVSLYDAGTNVRLVSKVTGADGTYIFSAADGVTPFANYKVRLDNSADNVGSGPLAGLVLTTPDNSTDLIDSDAFVLSNGPEIAVSVAGPGVNNHSYDFGFGTTDCTQRDMTKLSAQLDGSALGLSHLVKNALKTRTALSKSKPKSCKALSSATKTSLSKQAAAAYTQAWQFAWSVGPTTDICTSPLAVCITADIGPAINSIASNALTLSGLVDKALNGGGCTKATSSDKKKILKRAKTYNAVIDTTVSELRGLNPLKSCGGGSN